MLILNPLKKYQKDSFEKVINEKGTEKGVFYFYYCVQKFSDYNFFWVNCFAFFSTDSNSA